MFPQAPTPRARYQRPQAPGVSHTEAVTGFTNFTLCSASSLLANLVGKLCHCGYIFFATFKKQLLYSAALNSLSVRRPPETQTSTYRWFDLGNELHLPRFMLIWSIKASAFFLTQGTSCMYKYTDIRQSSKSHRDGAYTAFVLLLLER